MVVWDLELGVEICKVWVWNLELRIRGGDFAQRVWGVGFRGIVPELLSPSVLVARGDWQGSGRLAFPAPARFKVQHTFLVLTMGIRVEALEIRDWGLGSGEYGWRFGL